MPVSVMRPKLIQRMQVQPVRAVAVTFDSTRIVPTFDGTTMSGSHMRAKAALAGTWSGITSGFVQLVRSSVRTCVYVSEEDQKKVTVERRLPNNTLDGMSGDSPKDLYYSKGGCSLFAGSPEIDDQPSFNPDKEKTHVSGARCYLNMISIKESFHLMYVSEENFTYRLWWEGAWGHDLTVTVKMTRVESLKRAGVFQTKYEQDRLSGSVNKSNGMPLDGARTVALVAGRFATSFTDDVETVTHS